MTEIVRTELNDGVELIILNRPEVKNALDQALVRALGALLAELPGRDDVRAVVLAGEGGAFCSGADLKAGFKEREILGPDARLREFHALIRGVVGAPQPIIAAMEGPAVGFGADLALACDLRVMGEGAMLHEKFVKIGLMPDGGGSFWLPRLVGLARAAEILMLGEPLDAATCKELGLVNRVVPRGGARADALELARRLADGPPLALRAIKRALRESAHGGIEQALDRERVGQLQLLASSDFPEGVFAWMQKRAPKFTGK